MTTRIKGGAGVGNGEFGAATPAGAVMHLQASIAQQGAGCPGALEWAWEECSDGMLAFECSGQCEDNPWVPPEGDAHTMPKGLATTPNCQTSSMARSRIRRRRRMTWKACLSIRARATRDRFSDSARSLVAAKFSLPPALDSGLRSSV